VSIRISRSGTSPSAMFCVPISPLFSVCLFVTFLGFVGMIGVMGLDLIGVMGDTGTAGLMGDTGTAGLMGAKGLAGLMGATGLAGLMGATGTAGLMGDTGTAGLMGATGFVGLPVVDPSQSILLAVPVTRFHSPKRPRGRVERLHAPVLAEVSTVFTLHVVHPFMVLMGQVKPRATICPSSASALRLVVE